MTDAEADNYIMRSLRAVAGLKTVGGIGQGDDIRRLVNEEIAILERIAEMYPSKGPKLVSLVMAWIQLLEGMRAKTTESDNPADR